MNFLNKIAVFFVSALTLSSCVDKDPDFNVFPDPDVDFTYNVEGDQYTLDYYVVSPIQFTNTSVKQGAVTWDFGDGQTSNEANPVHKFESAGLYKVTLTVEGAGSRTYPILIYDILPQVSINTQSTEIVEFGDTKIDFNLFLPNPENKNVRYVWTFPEGTTDENGQPITSVEFVSNENGTFAVPANYLPKVKFSNIGSQKVEVASYFDIDGENRRLEDSYLNVQVGCSQPAATLYYAQRDGNIKAIKLLDLSQLPAGTKVLPYDLGVKSGQNPFNLVYAETDATAEDGSATKEGWIYVLDAGKQYYYVNDESGTLGDGTITAMRVDGTGVNTVLTNVGGYAFADPFQGLAYNGKLYYTDRNTGVSTLDLTTRGAVQELNSTRDSRASYFVKNDLIPYYGHGIAYGAIHSGIYRDSRGVWWWPKYYNANGIFRFKESDIYTSQALATGAPIPYPIVLEGANLRAFAIDETRGNLYVWMVGANEGFQVFDLPGDNEAGDRTKPRKAFRMEADPINSTTETVNMTQFALDQETGRVYMGFRPTATDGSGFKAGILYYDPATDKIVKYGETNDQIFGMTINPNKTKLF